MKLFSMFLIALLLPSVALAQSASTGIVGNPAATTATQVAGRDASGNLRVPLVSAGALSIVGSRAFIAKGTISNGTSAYSNAVVGGVVTIATGLPAGTIVTAATFRIKARASDVTTAGTPVFLFFDANPSGSTFTDGNAPVIAVADVPKMIQDTSSSWNAGSAGTVQQVAIILPRITVDASGNIYAVYLALSSTQFGSANILQFEIDGTY